MIFASTQQAYPKPPERARPDARDAYSFSISEILANAWHLAPVQEHSAFPLNHLIIEQNRRKAARLTSRRGLPLSSLFECSSSLSGIADSAFFICLESYGEVDSDSRSFVTAEGYRVSWRVVSIYVGNIQADGAGLRIGKVLPVKDIMLVYISTQIHLEPERKFVLGLLVIQGVEVDVEAGVSGCVNETAGILYSRVSSLRICICRGNLYILCVQRSIGELFSC